MSKPMCEKCNTTNEWTFCPYCGHELHKEENKSSMTQEEFDKIFLDMLKKANKIVWYDATGAKSDIPTCRFELRNPDNEWMFYARLDSGHRCFLCSYDRVHMIFIKQYGLKEVDIQRLMKNQLKVLFNMGNVTAYRCSYTAEN